MNKEILKKILLENLIDFHDFCIKHNLTYYLCGGTLIGAIRHNGFIPWDDDIDVMMPRKDYDKLIDVFSSQKSLELVGYHNTPNYFLNFVKIIDKQTKLKEKNNTPELGVFIDVFPIDGIPKNWFLKSTQKSILKFLLTINRVIVSYNYSKKSKILNLLLSFFTIFISPYLICKVIDKISKFFKYENSDEVSLLTAILNDEFDKKIIGKATKVEFEKHNFYAPENYHEYLTKFYGDFMTIPKLKERISHDYEYIRYK
jgi:lipopolysaccharide cholinephosphotransferase